MNRAERIKDAIANKAEHIDMKKATVKNSDACGFTVPVAKTDETKSAPTNKEVAGVINKTIVGNTYLWMDSHKDVHVAGCFVKSINERKDKIFHLHDHEYKLTAKVGKPLDIYEKEIAWKDLGIQKGGMTTALMMDTEIRKDYNSRIFDAYKSGEIDQHSVGMQYVKLELAADDESDEDAKKLWDTYLPQLANKDVAEAEGFFFVVKEAKLREISGVLLGSNTVTPTLETKAIEPSDVDTQPTEPTEQDTHKAMQEFINTYNSRAKARLN